MAGVQIAGLVSGIDWQNIISEIIQADSAGMNQVQSEQTTVNSKVTALGGLSTDLTNLENTIFDLEDPSVFGAVTAASTTSGSSWQVSAQSGAPIGNTTIDVSRLATASQLNGAGGISQGLSPTNDVSGLTVANLGLADPVTAGTFSIDGAQVTIDTSESLQDVFDAISSATGGTVTASYSATTDKVTLSSSEGPVVLGAVNDTSNFLQALKLGNNGESAVTSSGPLGALKTGVSLAEAGLATSLTGLDSSGNGSFAVNGVTIDYNADTDSLSTLLQRIDNSSAGVTASYDTTNNRIVLTNNSTGDTGIGINDLSGGNLAAALGLTSAAGASLQYGEDASFSVNGGPAQSSPSNVLGAAELGVAGLSVTVNTTGPQTIAVSADTTGMQSAIQAFITAFNQFQTDIGTNTKITTSSSGSVTTSLLSADHEVGDWGSQLEMTAFSAGGQVGGAVSSLDDMGIDFNGTTGQLEISDSAKLSQALSNNPAAVAAFFQTASTGFGAVMNGAINDIISQDTSETSDLQSESNALGDEITTMQNQLNAEQQQLENEFTEMESMEEQYQNEMQTLTSLYGSGSSGSGSSPSASSGGSSSSGSSSSSTSGTSSAPTSSTG